MSKPFEIIFDFPLADPDLIVTIKASVELHHSDPYYVVDHFHLARSKRQPANASILPAQEIKRIIEGDHEIWVHRDSERETVLSITLGKAIDALSERIE